MAKGKNSKGSNTKSDRKPTAPRLGTKGHTPRITNSSNQRDRVEQRAEKRMEFANRLTDNARNKFEKESFDHKMKLMGELNNKPVPQGRSGPSKTDKVADARIRQIAVVNQASRNVKARDRRAAAKKAWLTRRKSGK